MSKGGGIQPCWRPDGKELFYIGPDGRLVTLPVQAPLAGDGLEWGTPVPLFTGGWQVRTAGSVIRSASAF